MRVSFRKQTPNERITRLICLYLSRIQVMDSIRVPWMESLQRVVDKLNTLFEE